jgi:hypothetical protein
MNSTNGLEIVTGREPLRKGDSGGPGSEVKFLSHVSISKVQRLQVGSLVLHAPL